MVNLRNEVLAQLHNALDGRLYVWHVTPPTTPEEVIAMAETIKSEDTLYAGVRVRQHGLHSVSFQIQRIVG
jgi:hypothetical protein